MGFSIIPYTKKSTFLFSLSIKAAFGNMAVKDMSKINNTAKIGPKYDVTLLLRLKTFSSSSCC